MGKTRTWPSCCKVPQDDGHTDRARAAATRPMAAKRGLVTLDGARERLAALLVDGQRRADEPEVPLEGWQRRRAPNAQPVERDAQHVILHQPVLGQLGESDQIPDCLDHVPLTEALAFEPPIAYAPRPVVSALGTPLSHGANIA